MYVKFGHDFNPTFLFIEVCSRPVPFGRCFSNRILWSAGSAGEARRSAGA